MKFEGVIAGIYKNMKLKELQQNLNLKFEYLNLSLNLTKNH